jgi:hypothetical protein
MPASIVFVDLDGVVCDFAAGSLAAHRIWMHPKEVGWDFPAQVGFKPGYDPAFWRPLEHRSFWANLDPLPDGLATFRILEDALGRDRLGVLSSSLCPGATDGKRDWLRRHLPGWEAEASFSAVKWKHAAPCKVLVDDHGPTVERFRAAGGRAVLVPRPWNPRRGETCDRGLFDAGDLAAEILAAAAE